MRIYEGIEQLIGGTPLMRLGGFAGALGLNSEILGKLECFNPAGSVKDRVAKAMIEDAEEKGLLTAGSVIIEPTSGNTGIGLAAVGVHRGYRVILTMPDTMSVERRSLLKAYGAELVLTDGSKGMSGAIQKAEELAASIPHSFIPSQFENPANPAAHLASTGVEIWEDSGGSVDIFVSGVGTGGTISGVGAYLKSMRADIRVVAVEPHDSPVLSGGKAGPHELQGIGAGFVPKTLDKSVIDEVMAITGKEAYDACRTMARAEGLLVGISSGTALAAAAILARRSENAGKTIVALLPDGGEKYLSTPAFS